MRFLSDYNAYGLPRLYCLIVNLSFHLPPLVSFRRGEKQQGLSEFRGGQIRHRIEAFRVRAGFRFRASSIERRIGEKAEDEFGEGQSRRRRR